MHGSFWGSPTIGAVRVYWCCAEEVSMSIEWRAREGWIWLKLGLYRIPLMLYLSCFLQDRLKSYEGIVPTASKIFVGGGEDGMLGHIQTSESV